jgi:hypothetical protein
MSQGMRYELGVLSDLTQETFLPKSSPQDPELNERGQGSCTDTVGAAHAYGSS